MSSSNPVIEYRFYNENTNYGICLTIGTVTEKKVKCENFVLQTGSEIIVRFEFTNQRENPTLNVNETGAIPIYYRGAAISPSFLAATRTYLFTYNGSQYELVGDITNTYKEATMVDSGLISPEEKYKLFTIDYNANNYSHPIGTGNRHIPSGGTEGQILRWADDGLALWGDDLNTEYSDVTDDTSGLMSPKHKKKLDNIEENANNYTLPEAGSELGGVKSGGDVTIEDGVIRVNNDSHSHTSSSITDLESVLSNYIPRSEKGADNGVAILGEDGKLLASQIPGSVDDILEFEGLNKFPTVGEKGKLYVDILTNKTYRWSGSMYSIVSDSIALGETETTAYRGDLGKTAYDHSQSTGNPHNTKYSELKNIPETFTPKAHSHKSNEINQLKGYTKGTEYTSIEETDSLNEALGKLEKGLELKPDTDTTYELVTTTNAGLMSPEDKLKLNNIEEFANNYTYTLYKATDTELGGIRTGYTQNNRNYPIVLDENGKAYVNVPWVDNDTSYTEATQTTSGLMPAADKKKLDGIDIGANNYKLPTAGEEVLGGIKIGYTQDGRNYPVQLNEENKAFVNVPWIDTNTTYGIATASTAGLMSSEDRIKLNGIAENANNYTYTLPVSNSNDLGGIKIGYEENGKNYPVELDTNNKAYVNVPWTDTTYGNVTTDNSGLMTPEDKSKLDSIEENANNYTLPNATSSTLGGFKTGYTQSGKNYPVILNSSNQAYVNVPWTDNDTTYSEATTDNSGLMSASDKTKLESIEDNANNYTLPKSTSSDLGGVKVGYTQSGKNYPVELDTNGNAYVAVPWTDTTYGDATTSKSGLMSSSDKSKLDGIAANANNYTLPNASSDNLGGIKTGYTQTGKNYPIILDSNNNAYVAVPWTDTTYSEVTSSKDGLMTSEDKKKLDGIAANANNYTLPTSTADNLGGIKIGYTQNGKNYPIILDSNGKAYVAVPWTDNNTYLSSRADDASQVAVGVSNGTTLLYGEIADRQLNAVDTSSSTADLAVNDSIKLALKKLQNKIAEVSSIAAAGMRLKGEVSAPITTTAKIGDTYKATSKFTIAAANSNTGSAITVNIGDTIIALEQTPIWFVIPSGDEILNVATSETLGGVKVGYTQSGKNYPVQLDSNNKAYVNVPWTDNNTTYNEATTGAAGLMSASDKSKLNDIEANANNYTLPKSTTDTLGGVKIGYSQNGKNYPVVLDTNGNAYVNVPWADNNTTYNEATQTTAGLMPAADKKKLDGIAENANNYSLPTSTSSVLGGVKVGYTQSGKNYPLVLDDNGNAYVAVPWTDTTYGDVTTSKSGLMTSSDKSKLDGIASGANNYTLPASTENALGGIKIGYTQNGKNYPIVLDSNGKAYVNVPWADNNTTYNEATQTTAGLMPASDKKKLDGIAENANNYSLPATTADNLGGIKIGYTQSGKNYPIQIDTNNKAYVNVPWTDNDTTYSEATTDNSGLMSASDKSKLNGIAANANNYSLPTSTSNALGGIKIGYTQSGKNYPVVLDSNGRAYVYVPWEDTNTTYTLSSFGITATADQLNYTSGVTSNIQNQLNAKQAKHATVSVTLNASGWSNKSQTITVNGVTASNTVIVGPAPTSVDLYGNAGIICTAQAANSLSFSCNIVPTSNITVNVIILN